MAHSPEPELVKGDSTTHGHPNDHAGPRGGGTSVHLRRRHDARLPAILLICVIGGLLGACGGNGATDSTAPASTSPPATASPQPLELGSVVWTTGIATGTGAPVDRVSVFPRDAVAIHAAVEARSLPAGTTLTAAWEINGQPIEALSTTVTVDQPRRGGWADFRLEWAGETRWPAGTLAIRISASTGETVEGTVRIR